MNARTFERLTKLLGALVLGSAMQSAAAATAVPAVIEAENYDDGGQGAAYHDNVAGNAGGEYRTDEDVDIVATYDKVGDYDVNNFETGEWMNYTVDVARSGNYLISLRVSTAFDDSAYRIDVDHQDVSGRVIVPSTNSWRRYAWLEPVSGYLTAGRHVLTVTAEQQYFNLNSLRVEAGPDSSPFGGAPAPVPGIIEAEKFDIGGQDVAYHDNVAGNSGGQFRPDEDVDIVASSDSELAGYDVNNFETGEWLGYTIDVAEAGTYAIDTRTATALTDSAYRIEIDGKDATGRVPVVGSSSWSNYSWQGGQTVELTAGTHFLRVIADQQYFNLNALRLSRVSATAPFNGVPASVPGVIEAEDFDLGGQDAAYLDRTPGNDGGLYRQLEDVDIVATQDSLGGSFDVNGFETGEWLNYTFDVAEAGDYEFVLRAASAFADSAFRLRIDGADVGTRAAVPNTGSWGSYADVVASPVVLAAGTHVLTVIADAQYFNLNRITVRAPVENEPSAEPWGGTPAVVPGSIGAANFDLGGEGVAYSDNSIGNTGGAYRPDEDVDIVPAGDTSVSAYDVNSFETGEWMSYTVDVAAAGDYDVELRVSSAFADSVARIEIDGQAVGGDIAVPATGGWSSYQWVGAADVPLTTGVHVIRVHAVQQYFNMNALRVMERSDPQVDPGSILFLCTFPSSATDCGFRLQAKDSSRAFLTGTARDGNTGIVLRTESGDSNVAGSGNAERTDLWINQATTDGYEGSEAWWAHSILFPNDYVAPPSGWGVAFDFHNTASGAWQANFHVDAGPNGLALRGYGGVNSGDGRYGVSIGPVQRNVWYDFVYHVRWSSGSDGFFDAWLNGERILAHRGPTLYDGQGVYLKLANYHSPLGQASSIIHDRIVRGTTALAVSDEPLEGVLELVNGVLTPITP